MKNLLYFSIGLFCLIPAFSFSQAGHSLTFNQALLVTGSAATVPTGRVWKIENVLPSTNVIATVPNAVGNTTTQVSTTECIILINGNSIPAISSKATSNNSYSDLAARPIATSVAVQSIFPSAIWLPEGTTLAAGTNVQYVSVLEFILE